MFALAQIAFIYYYSHATTVTSGQSCEVRVGIDPWRYVSSRKEAGTWSFCAFPLAENEVQIKAFEFYYRCLQFFEHNPETMQCFVVDTTKAPFFRSLIRALKYTDVVLVLKNYWDDFIPTL